MAVQVCEEKPRVASVTVETICEDVTTAPARVVQLKVPYKPVGEERTTKKNKEQPGFDYADKIFYEELRLWIESREP